MVLSVLLYRRGPNNNRLVCQVLHAFRHLLSCIPMCFIYQYHICSALYDSYHIWQSLADTLNVIGIVVSKNKI